MNSTQDASAEQVTNPLDGARIAEIGSLGDRQNRKKSTELPLKPRPGSREHQRLHAGKSGQ